MIEAALGGIEFGLKVNLFEVFDIDLTELTMFSPAEPGHRRCDACHGHAPCKVNSIVWSAVPGSR